MYKSLLEDSLEILFPTSFKCACCGEEINNKQFLICENCLKQIKVLNGKTCEICNEPIFDDGSVCVHCKYKKPNFDYAFSLLDYDGPIVKLIKNYKYRNATYLTETLCHFLIKSYLINNCNADYIVPVPLHFLRLKERGYNQSALLACELAKNVGVPCVENNLIRVVNTKTQTDLTRMERKENLLNAFKVKNKKQFKNKTIVLIDDVYTTGSTLNECAETLKNAGCKKVICLILCHNSIQTRINKLK